MPSATPYADPHRTEFQLERVILFTDAVFAIAITLLVIEIRVPEFHHRPTSAQIWEYMAGVTGQLIAFAIAFFVIAVYWVAHHRIFRFVVAYDQGLIWRNIVFLFSIALMPFTAGVYGLYATVLAPYVIYTSSITFSAAAFLWLLTYLRDPRRRMVAPGAYTHPDLDVWRPLTPVAGFALGLVLALWQGDDVNRWLPLAPLLILPFSLLHRRRHRRLLNVHRAVRPTDAPDAADTAGNADAAAE